MPMGYYDKAQSCELVAAILLNKSTTGIDEDNIGLCRDDGFNVLKNHSRPKPSRKDGGGI